MLVVQLGVAIYYCCILCSIGSISRTVRGGTGPIYMTNVQCTGSEAGVTDCATLPSGRICSHSEDAGVTCLARTGTVLIWNNTLRSSKLYPVNHCLCQQLASYQNKEEKSSKLPIHVCMMHATNYSLRPLVCQQ